MKRNLAKILALVLLLSLLVPGMASAAETDTYKVTVTVAGPAEKSVSGYLTTQAANASLSGVLSQLELSKHNEIASTFSGTTFADEYAEILDKANNGSEAAWTDAYENFVDSTDPAAAADVLKNKDATIWALAQVAETVTMTYKGNPGYTVKIELTVDTVAYIPPTTTPTPTPSAEPVTGAEITTETVTDTYNDGSTVVTETVTTKTTNEDGTVTESVAVTETSTNADGNTATVVSDGEGNVSSIAAEVSEEALADAVENGEAVVLPLDIEAAGTAEEAIPVAITLPEIDSDKPVSVTVAVNNLTPTTVAVLVHGDGTEEIIPVSVATGDGIAFQLEGSANVKFVDNAKEFTDVPAGKWYAGYVDFAASREIMNGKGDGIFDPAADTTRGELVTLLMNTARGEAAEITSEFPDVTDIDWYAEGVSWAIENGIAQGRGEDFGAKDSATREQVAVMLYNFAVAKGYDVSATDDLAAFEDSADVSSWAETAMRWAVGSGLINGMGDGTVNPKGNATRAQVAAMMERFCENVLASLPAKTAEPVLVDTVTETETTTEAAETAE